MTRLKHENKLKTMLTRAYDKVAVHKALLDTPIQMELLELEEVEVNEDGTETITNELSGYASINKLSEIFGNQFVPTEIINDFVMVRWAFQKGLKEESKFEDFLVSMGLTNFIEDTDIEEVDFTSLAPNNYLCLGDYESTFVPKRVSEEL